MDRVRASFVQVLHLVKNHRPLTLVLTQQPRGATADFMSDFGVGRAVVVHQHDLRRHTQIKGAIDRMDSEPRAPEPVVGPRQAVAFGERRELAKCEADGLNVSGKGKNQNQFLRKPREITNASAAKQSIRTHAKQK